MTSSTKQYVEIGDLAAVVATCTSCHATLSLPLDGTSLTLPLECPCCRETWYLPQMDQATIGARVNAFYNALGHLRRTFEKNGQPKSLTMKIEIKNVFPVPVSSTGN